MATLSPARRPCRSKKSCQALPRSRKNLCLGSMSVLSAPVNPSKFSLSCVPRPACLLCPPIASVGKKSRRLAS
jgi:hypothetical protein